MGTGNKLDDKIKSFQTLHSRDVKPADIVKDT